MMHSDWDDERIATQQKPNQGDAAGIKFSFKSASIFGFIPLPLPSFHKSTGVVTR